MEHQCKDCKHNHLNDGNEDMCSACSGYSDKFEPIEDKPMEVKCKKCKLGTGGRICGYKNSECSGSNYKYFVPMEKTCENCYDAVGSCYNYVKFELKEKPMEKKYKVEKSLPINIGLLVGHIYDESYFKYLDIARIIKEEYIKEVKEDTLESIFDENFIGDEIKKNLKQCIVKQKIELLYAIRSKDEPIAIEIDNKISELQKEIK